MGNKSFKSLCELGFIETQTGKKVTVRMGAPAFDPEHATYHCLTEISGLEGGNIAPAHGVDPFQAICMSLERFRVLFAKHGGDFRTAGGSSPHTVFPKEIPWVYGSDVYQRLCKMVDAEIQKIEDELTRRREGRDRDEEK
jgi:hypothetical protein